MPAESNPKSILEEISTRWSFVNDPLQFVMRYAPAIRNYLGAIIKNQHDAEEVTQDFLMRAVQHGFRTASADRGRFRDYLKAAVRNAAFKHLGRRKPATLDETALVHLSTTSKSDHPAEQKWLDDWKRCVLDRCWRALDRHQMKHPGNLFHTVLKLAVEHPEEDSSRLAQRASEKADHPLRADAFRKQLSRARRQFAELLLLEIRQTVENPTPERLEEELLELGLMEYVRDFLPEDVASRRDRGVKGA